MNRLDENTIIIAYATIVAPILAVLGTIAFQIWKSRKDRQEAIIEDIRRRRISIISDLFAYRFVLTDGMFSADALTSFSYALNRIPIEFHDHKAVLDAYREIGTNFTSEKFYSFLRLLMEAVEIDADLIDRHMVEAPPSASSAGFGIGAFTKGGLMEATAAARKPDVSQGQ